MIKEKMVVSKKYEGYIQTVLIDGICPYTKNTEEYYINNGFLVMTDEELEPIHEKYLNDLCNSWKEISEDQYENALNELPPTRWRNGGFYISESYTGDVSSFYQEMNGKYYTSFQRLSYDRGEIMINLIEHISQQNTH